MARIPWLGIIAIAVFLMTIIAIVVQERSDSRRPASGGLMEEDDPIAGASDRPDDPLPAVMPETSRNRSGDLTHNPQDHFDASKREEPPPIWTEYYDIGEWLSAQSAPSKSILAPNIGRDPFGLSGDDLVALIKDTVSASSWSETGRSIDVRNDLLAVEQSGEAHREIKKLLDELRRGTLAPSITIKTWLLCGFPGEFESLGISFSEERGEGNGLRYAMINDLHLRAFLRNRDRVANGSLTLSNGGIGNTSVINQFTYVKEENPSDDPIIDVANVGVYTEILPIFLPRQNVVKMKIFFEKNILANVGKGPLEIANVINRRMQGDVAIPVGAMVAVTGDRLSINGEKYLLVIRPTVTAAPDTR